MGAPGLGWLPQLMAAATRRKCAGCRMATLGRSTRVRLAPTEVATATGAESIDGRVSGSSAASRGPGADRPAPVGLQGLVHALDVASRRSRQADTVLGEVRLAVYRGRPQSVLAALTSRYLTLR